MKSKVDIKWNSGAVVCALHNALAGTLATIAEDLKDKSLAETPKESGELRDSCKVDVSNMDNLQVRVSYDAQHAVVQHEKTELKHHNGGKAKFLEDPFNKNVKRYKQMIADSVGEVRR
ncbi:MAG: hypothetical protein KAQ68_00730 [Clostridiales bacterium]|nr:hypothetical protein [Clostridiales bacterium]